MHHARTVPKQLKFTIKKIGEGAQSLTRYLPAIKHAQRLASKAAPKNYLGQAKNIYDDFLKNWRYVYDPHRVEMVHVSGPSLWGEVFGANRDKRNGEHGSGDCDDAAALMAGMLGAIGLKTRIATTSPPGSPSIFTHVFAQAYIPSRGWITVDPVGFPKHNFGWIQPHQRIAYWDLDGKLIKAQGNLPKNFRLDFSGDESRGIEMYNNGALAGLAAASERSFPDRGMVNYGLAGTDNEEPADWSTNQIEQFGAYTDRMPIIAGSHIMMDVDEDDALGDTGLVRTKMLEMSPQDIQHIRQTGFPRPNSVALSDDGEVYQFTQDPQLGGFFKKLRKRIKKRVRRGIRRVKGFARKLIKRLPGGKYLLKIAGRLHKIAMKIVKPLTKFVGKWAKRLAPIAAFIPGFGPAVAGALLATGKIAQIATKIGVKINKITGKPDFKSGRQARRFKKVLEQQARQMKRSGKAKEITRRAFRIKKRKSRRLLKLGTDEHAQAMQDRGLGGY